MRARRFGRPRLGVAHERMNGSMPVSERSVSPHVLAPAAVSGFAPEQPSHSLALIHACDLNPDDPILDVGAADPPLIEALLAEGFRDITVIASSADALDAVRARLGERGDRVKLLHADPLHFHPLCRFALWHDGVLFRGLGHPEERQQYAEVAQQALRPEGHLILTGRQFELGNQFELLDSQPAPEARSRSAAHELLHCRFCRHAPRRLSA